ncbi:MAG TPA: AAA family ATPase [Candidatus Methylomirabilis sp.]|nr:AAA family ATPase [Candidatus Methylomirabilis sp.]
MRERRFRADLLSRLTVRFTMPPLRQRAADIVPLAEKFLAEACSDFGLPPKRLSPSTHARLEQHPWPDNARGLRNMIENAVIFTPGPVIGTDNLEIGSLSDGEERREHYVNVLEQTSWNISRAAQLLGISRPTLRARIARWKLQELRALRQRSEPTAPARDPEITAPNRIAETGLESRGEAAPDLGDAREPSGAPAAPGADPRDATRERRWLGFLRFSLTGPDADDVMVSARPYLDIALEKVQQFGAHVVALSSTGLDAAFGLDAAEGSVQRAGFAALAIQVATVRARQDWAGAPDWTIALHAMSSLIASDGGAQEIDGADRARAAEVLDALVSGESRGGVLASGDIVPFLRRRFTLGSPVSSGPAGQARPVLGPRRHPGGFGDRPGAFVGRCAEMETLEARWAMACQGSGQIVGIVGDPGVGKSRLVWEFAHRGPDRGWLVLDTASVTLGRPVPFFAAINLLRSYFDAAPGEAAEAVRGKVARRLASLSLTPLLPVFLALLDVAAEDVEGQMLEPAQRRRQTLSAIKRLIAQESVRQPLLLVFEDAHWIDPETRELLDEIADGLPRSHVLALVTYRPEYQHGWSGWSFYTQLRLEPLRGESAGHLIDELLGADPSLAPLRLRLTQWTDGNPFFVEELVQTLAETGALQGERGAYRLAHPVDDIVVPGTVEEVLASRIARLGQGPAELLRAAAVVGRQVPYRVLAAVSREREETLTTHLRALQTGEFLYGAGEGEERLYTFRHALTQEVAYASLTDDQRRVLHSRAMDATALVYETREDEKISELAHHAFEGHRWEHAASYLRRAGQRAFARSANREAVECFTRALTALSHLPPSRALREQAIDLRFDLRNALWPLGEIDRVDQILDEAGALSRELADLRRQGLAAAARCHYFWVMSRHAEAVSAGEEALDLARTASDRTVEYDATVYMGVVQGAMGNYRRAVELLQAALDVDEAASAQTPGRDWIEASRTISPLGRPTARTYIARYLSELGEFRQAAEHAAAGLKAGEHGRGPFFLATHHFGVGTVALRRGDFDAAIPLLEHGLALCESHGIRNWFPAMAASLGYAYSCVGRPAEGLALLERAREHADRMRVSAGYSMLFTHLGHAYLCLGRIADGERAAQAALDWARKHDERGYEAWALYLGATLAVASGSSTIEQIEEAFGHAMRSARALGMRPLLAHCHGGLADAYARAGQPERAVEERGVARVIREEVGMVVGDLETTTPSTAAPRR